MSDLSGVVGLSSSSGVRLVKMLASVEQSNNVYLRQKSVSTFDASSKSSLSADTLFSIAASASISASEISAGSEAPASGASVGASFPAANDPHYEADYTISQAGENYYAALAQDARFDANSPGETVPGETDGQIIAASLGMTGDKAVSYAQAFDSRTLVFAAMNSVPGLDARCNTTFIKDSSGTTIGSTTSMSINQKAFLAFTEANPNTSWTQDWGAKDTGGLLVSW